jgi:GLPGLI family protein
MEIVDSFSIRIIYSCKQITDTAMITKIKEDIHILEIGNNMSKYYSYTAFRSDSLCTEWILKHKNAQSKPRYIDINEDKQNPFWTEIFKLKKEYLVYERFPEHCKYVENINLQNWQIYDDTLTIVNYLCQKATCNFRGRNYTAWFTSDIPLDQGPWKFGGLPGLILQINDSKNHYVFTCIGIEQTENTCHIKRYKSNYKFIERNRIAKIVKDRYDDFTKKLRLEGGGLWLRSPNGTTVEATNTIIKFPYNPIELE